MQNNYKRNEITLCENSGVAHVLSSHPTSTSGVEQKLKKAI